MHVLLLYDKKLKITKSGLLLPGSTGAAILLSPYQLPSRGTALCAEAFSSAYSCVSQVCSYTSGNNMMNFAASLCRRMNLKELVTNTPVYSGASDVSGEGLSLMFRRWATKKTAGSTKNGRDSKPKMLGVKKFGGERVIPGNIIVRQRGTRFHPGNYVGIGKDHTLYALKAGNVKFERHKLSGRKWVHVEPMEGHVLHPVYTNIAAPKLQTTA